MKLAGKVALVTGGATGIGFATAKVLAESGASVAIAQRDKSRGEAAVRRLVPHRVLSLELDVRDSDSIDRCCKDVSQAFGGIDILVNNASLTGAAALASVLDSPSELIDQVVDTNLKGTFYCSQSAARSMVADGRRGSIIHVSSVAAFAAQENASIYCATKAAQAALAQAMAIELAQYGIRVNCVAPGDIKTETSVDAVGQIERSGASGRFLRYTPLGRRGLPEEVGRAILFLASDDASFITGTTLLVDGGFLAY